MRRETRASARKHEFIGMLASNFGLETTCYPIQMFQQRQAASRRN